MTVPVELRRPWEGLAGAVAFLTLVPVPAAAHRRGSFDLGPALAWFPLVGAGVGAIGGALRVLLGGLLGAGPSVVVALLGIVAVTGALHQDALADTADGLGVRGDRERRLAVMRDSTLGAFGVLSLVLWGLLAFSALSSLSPARGLVALVGAGACGRGAAVVHGRLAAAARTDGLGAGLGATWPRAAAAMVLAAAPAVIVAGPARGGLCVAVALGVAGASALGARRAFGGATGDTLGATVAVTELAVLLALLASWR